MFELENSNKGNICFRLAEYLGWDSNELVGQSVFDFHHAQDNGILDKSFKSRK